MTSQTAQPRVLLIEDDVDLAGMYAERMRRDNFKVDVINNGRTALELLSTEQPWPAAIVLDLMLPGVSGFEILKYLAQDKRTKQTPVIICTAFADEAHQQQASEMGFKDYYLKTHLTPGELTRLILSRLNLTN